MTAPRHEGPEAGNEPLIARFGLSLLIAIFIGLPITLVYQGPGLRAGQELSIWQTALSFAIPLIIAMVMPSLAGSARAGVVARAEPPGQASETNSDSPGARRTVVRARPDLRAVPDDVLHRLDEATRIVGQIRKNPSRIDGVSARGCVAEQLAGGSPAARETVGELSQAIGAAVAEAERTASNAAEQVQQFQAIVERLDRLRQDGPPVIPSSPSSIGPFGDASSRLAASGSRAGGS